MAVTFTKAKDLIEVIATRLAAEATAAGEAALSSALTEFAQEVSTESPTEAEFFQNNGDGTSVNATGVASTWCDILDSASNLLKAKAERIIKEEVITIDNNLKVVADEITTIDDHLKVVADEITTIDNHLDTNGPEGNLAEKFSDIRDYQLRMRELADGTGIRFRGGRNLGEIFYYRNWIGNRKIFNPDPSDSNPLSAAELSQLASLIWDYRQRIDQIDAFFNDFDGPDGDESSGTGV